MLKRTTLIILILNAILFTGCNKQPKIPSYHIKPTDKIGYIIEPNESIVHRHIGTTIFNNFDKKYDYNWNLERSIAVMLKQNISFNLIDLNQFNIKASDVKNMIISKNGKWVVAKKKLYDYLLRTLNLKAIISIDREGAIAGPTYTLFTQNGLYSRNALGLKMYIAASTYKPSLYILNPRTVIKINDTEDTKLIYSSVYDSHSLKSGFQKPKDIENLTRDELQPVRSSILRMLNESISKLQSYIR